MTFGERLVQARNEKGYKQKQLADLLGITPTRLNYWEKDKREPDVEMVKRISRLLDVSADWLIGNASTEGNLPFTLDITEIKIVKKYRSLDAYGQRAICELLETEHERCTQQDTQTNIIELPFSLLKASAGTGNWLDEEQMDTICVVDTSTAAVSAPTPSQTAYLHHLVS